MMKSNPWAIDATEIRAIEQRALKEEPLERYWLNLLIVLFAIGGFIAVFQYLAGGRKWWQIPIAVGFGLFAFIQRRQSRLKFMLPRTLAKEGRCLTCGSDLKNNSGGACPECGEKVSSSERAYRVFAFSVEVARIFA
jgi:DNA-directed RNA polymerase subunit RPC12/RpoP